MSQINLVLLPGLDGTGRLFDPLLKVVPLHLKPSVISYPSDTPLSYAELLKYIQAKIQTDEPFALLAESFSGPVAVEFAASHPPNLNALILCASFVTSPVFLRRLRFIFKDPLFRLRPPQFFVRRFLLGRDAPPSLVKSFLDVLRSIAPEILSDRVRSVLTVDARQALKACGVPILYLAVRQDYLVGERCLAEIKSLKPNIKVLTIDGPHFLLQREPTKSIQAIIRFLDGI